MGRLRTSNITITVSLKLSHCGAKYYVQVIFKIEIRYIFYTKTGGHLALQKLSVQGVSIFFWKYSMLTVNSYKHPASTAFSYRTYALYFYLYRPKKSKKRQKRLCSHDKQLSSLEIKSSGYFLPKRFRFDYLSGESCELKFYVFLLFHGEVIFILRLVSFNVTHFGILLHIKFLVDFIETIEVLL